MKLGLFLHSDILHQINRGVTDAVRHQLSDKLYTRNQNRSYSHLQGMLYNPLHDNLHWNLWTIIGSSLVSNLEEK